MKTPCITSLKAVLWIVCIPHLIMGILGCLPFVDITQIAAVVYKATVAPSAQLEHVARMLAGYFLVIGLLAFFAIKDPLKSSSIISALSVLLFIRVFQMLTFAKDAFNVFGIPAYWYWGQAILFIIMAIALIFLRPRPESSCCKN